MRPDSIRNFDRLWLGSIVLGLINFALGYSVLKAQFEAQMAEAGMPGANSSLLLGGIVLGTLINLALWFLVSRQRIEIVKWVMAAFLLYSLLSLPAMFADGFQLIDGISLLLFAMQAGAIYCLFRPDAKAWFAEKRNPASGE